MLRHLLALGYKECGWLDPSSKAKREVMITYLEATTQTRGNATMAKCSSARTPFPFNSSSPSAKLRN